MNTLTMWRLSGGREARDKISGHSRPTIRLPSSLADSAPRIPLFKETRMIRRLVKRSARSKDGVVWPRVARK